MPWDVILIIMDKPQLKHEDLKRNRISFKDQQPSLTFFFVYISHFDETFFKIWQKSKESLIDVLPTISKLISSINLCRVFRKMNILILL